MTLQKVSQPEPQLKGLLGTQRKGEVGSNVLLGDYGVYPFMIVQDFLFPILIS